MLRPQNLYKDSLCVTVSLQGSPVSGPQILYTRTGTVLFQGSPVSGPRGLYIGDEVRSIGGCHVSGVTDWLSCVNAAMAARTSSGYCMPLTQLNKYNIALEGTTASCLMPK